MQVIINYHELLEGLKSGIEARKHQHGLFYRAQGRIRSVLAGKILQKIGSDDQTALLALLWAIFKPNAFEIFSIAIIDNRSNVFAKYIAEALIQGSKYVRSDDYFDHLDSRAFSKSALSSASDDDKNMDSPLVEGGSSSFVKTRGVRWLLRKAVEALSPDQQQEVLKSAVKIAKILDSSNEAAEIGDDVLPSRELIQVLKTPREILTPRTI